MQENDQPRTIWMFFIISLMTFRWLLCHPHQIFTIGLLLKILWYSAAFFNTLWGTYLQSIFYTNSSSQLNFPLNILPKINKIGTFVEICLYIGQLLKLFQFPIFVEFNEKFDKNWKFQHLLNPSRVIVYYVPRRTMRIIARRATMLAGDRSRGAISPASILSESRNYPNCVH